GLPRGRARTRGADPGGTVLLVAPLSATRHLFADARAGELQPRPRRKRAPVATVQGDGPARGHGLGIRVGDPGLQRASNHRLVAPSLRKAEACRAEVKP